MKFLRLLKNEYYRVFGNYKIVLAMLLFFVGNAVLLFFYTGNDDVDRMEYKELKETLSAINEEERLSTLYEMQMEGQDTEAVNQLIDEYETAYGYSEYLAKIQEEAVTNAQVSIFKNSTFATQNLKKTAEAFAKLSDVEVECTGSYGLNLVMSFMGTDIFLLIITMILIAIVLLDDKKSGIMPMLRATHYGGKTYAVVKMTTVTTICFAMSCIMKTCNILMGLILYGDVSFDASFQSLYGFDKSSFECTIGQGVVCGILLSGFVYIFLSIAMFLFAVMADNYIIYYLITGAFLALEYILYYMGMHKGVLTIFAKLNILAMVSPNSCMVYYNYNLFGRPVPMLPVNIVGISILTVIAAVVAVILFARSNVEYRAVSFHLGNKKKKPGHGLMNNEAYKLFIGNKVLVLIVALALLQVYLYHDKAVSWYTDEILYKSYINQIEGDYTEEKYAIMEEEAERFEDLYSQLEEYDDELNSGEITQRQYDELIEPVQEELNQENAFNRAYKYVTYIKDLEDENKGIVYDRGWKYLAGDGTYENEILNGIILMLFIILALAGIISQEDRYNMNALINTSYKKRRSLGDKIIIMMLVVLFGYLAVYLPELIWVMKGYGLSGEDYSVRSVMLLQNVTLDCTLKQYFVIVYIVRFLMTAFAAAAAALIGKLVKNQNITIIIAIIIFIMPLLLKMMGIDVIDSFSFNRFISGNMLFIRS